MVCPFCSCVTIPIKYRKYTSAHHFLRLLDPRVLEWLEVLLEMARRPVKLHQKTYVYEELAGATW